MLAIGEAAQVEIVGYPSPEEAAMAEWIACPTAHASIVSVEYLTEDEAVVVTDTEPPHPMWNYVRRGREGWVFTHDHN